MRKAKPENQKKPVILGVRVTKERAAQLQDIASRMDIRPTISQLIDRAIAEYIERMLPGKRRRD